jgi:putative heme-binding domain-containing protein
VQKAALEVVAGRPEWADELARTLRRWLGDPDWSAPRAALLREALLSRAASPLVQQVVADALGDPGTAAPARDLLLEVIARASLKKLPEAWLPELGRALREGEPELRMRAVATVQERALKNFDPALKDIARDATAPADLRLAALGAIAPRLTPVEADLLGWLRGRVTSETEPATRLAAARTLAALRLSGPQLTELAQSLDAVDALALPTVLRAFGRSTNEAVGLALVAAADQASATSNLSAEELGALLKKYPPAVQRAAAPLLTRLGVDLEEQQARLGELSALLTGGDFSRGKQIFFGPKAACATCHRVSGQGGLLGPNLTQIAEIRTGRDLLESIVYPGTSIVQGYHTFTVETLDGELHSGLVARQTPEAVWLRGTDLAEQRIEMKHVRVMRESPTSIMPGGLADALDAAELRDLLAFLQGLKRLTSSAVER